MKVILNKDVKGIGKKLQVVNVSEGYARNYLLPQNIAKPADEKNLNENMGKLSSIQFKKDTEKESALENKKKLENVILNFSRKVGENSKLFGSVTEKDISEELNKKYNINIDKKKIKILENVKELGIYNAEIKLYEKVIAKIKINVTRQD